jgi:hypothetical protein
LPQIANSDKQLQSFGAILQLCNGLSELAVMATFSKGLELVNKNIEEKMEF